MAKKSKSPKPNGSTGIYRTIRAPMTEENAKAYCESFNRSAVDRLANIKGELVEFVLQYLEGPYTQEQYEKVTGTMRVVDTGDGNKVYRELSAVEEEAGSPHIHQYHHAIEALSEIHTAIEPNLNGGDQDQLFRATLKLGMLLERMAVRPYEPLVKKGIQKVKDTRVGADKTNAPYVELHSRYQRMVDSKMESGQSYTEATDAVGTDCSVSGRTVRNHTGNPDTA